MWPAQLLKLQKKKRPELDYLKRLHCILGPLRFLSVEKLVSLTRSTVGVSLRIVVQMQPRRLIAMKMFCHQTPLWQREEISQCDIKLILRALRKHRRELFSFPKWQARHSAQALQRSKKGDILTLDAVDEVEGGVTAALVVRGYNHAQATHALICSFTTLAHGRLFKG